MPDADFMVHVIDDDAAFRTSLLRLLKAGGYAARAYDSVGELLLGPLPESPGCFMLDVCLPGPSGLDFQQALKSWSNPLPVIFMSAAIDAPTIVRAISNGAVDFLAKPVEAKDVFHAIEQAMARDREDREARRQAAEFRQCYESLSAREREVLVLVVSGYLNREIAEQLSIAERTVKAHRAQVMEKMHARSLPMLVRTADMLSVGEAESRNVSTRVVLPGIHHPSPDQLSVISRPRVAPRGSLLHHPDLAVNPQPMAIAK